MPFYDYACDRCGVFRAVRPMSESRRPQPCPGCGAPSPRALSAPFLAGVGESPDVGAARGGERVSWRHMCGFGCSHCR